MNPQDQNDTDHQTTHVDPVLQDMEEIVADASSESSPHDDGSTGTTSDDPTVQNLQNALARAQADYQNLRMRIERDRADMVSYLSAKILGPLLTQVDNLERAVKTQSGIEGNGFVDGVRAVFAGMQKYLESQGAIPFDSIGQEVDPERHDVMTEMAGEAGKIVGEFEKGYMLHDRVLRHAKVVVGNGA